MADRNGAEAMDPLQLLVKGTVVVFVFLRLGRRHPRELDDGRVLAHEPPRTGTWQPDAGQGVPDGSKAMGARIGLPQRLRGPKAALAPKLLIPVNVPRAWQRHTSHIEWARFIPEH